MFSAEEMERTVKQKRRLFDLPKYLPPAKNNGKDFHSQTEIGTCSGLDGMVYLTFSSCQKENIFLSPPTHYWNLFYFFLVSDLFDLFSLTASDPHPRGQSLVRTHDDCGASHSELLDG